MATLNDLHKASSTYLIGVKQDKDGVIVANSARPIANTFVALKSDQTKVVSHIELDDKDAPNQINAVTGATQLYLTNEYGAISNFESGKVNNKRLNTIAPFTTGNELLAIPKAANVYFPPQQLIMYNLVAHGYENWTDEIRKNIDSIAGINQSGMALDDDKHKVLNVALHLTKEIENPKTSDDKQYNSWLKDIKADGEDTVNAIIVPQTRAIAIVFSNEAYLDARVKIFNREGKAVFSSSPFEEKNTQRTVKTVNTNGSNTGACAAVFYDPLNEYDDSANAIDKVYRIEITLRDRESKDLGFKNLTYNLVERLRFPITNIAGEFEFINGDAISLEEAMIKQFPTSYQHLVEKISGSDDPVEASDNIKQNTPGFASYLHGLTGALNSVKTAGGILGAEHGVLATKAFGGLLVDQLEDFSSIKTGNVSIKDSISLAFGVYDSAGDIAGLIKDIRRLPTTDLGLLSNVVDVRGVTRAIKDSDALKAVEDVADRIAGAHEAIDLNNVINLSDKYKNIIRKGNGLFNKAADIAGKPLDALSMASAVHEAIEANKNVDSSRIRYKKLMIDYAKRVHMAERTQAKTDKNNTAKKQIESYQQQHIEVEKQKNGDVYNLFVTFQFDKSQFKPDQSFDDFKKLFLALPDTTQLTLIGHTCNIGTPEYNLGLSLRRAQSVKNALSLSAADSQRVIVEGRGESEPRFNNSLGESEQQKNRRVVAQLVLQLDKSYYPSREGLDVLERARSIYTLNFSAQDDVAKKAAIATIDLIMGAPKVHPLHAAAALLWYVGGALMDIGSYVDKLVFGEDFLKAINQLDQQGLLAVANQALMMVDQDSKDGRNGDDVLSEQFRLRAEALSGLQRLLMRCAIENGSWLDDLRSGGDLVDYRDTRTSFEFNDNVKYYRIEEYVERYLLNDGWEMDMGPIFPVALDEQWIQLIETGQLDKQPEKPDADFFEKSISNIRKNFATSFNPSDLLSPVFLISEDARQLKKQAISGLATSPILGANYIWHNIKNVASGHRQHTTRAKFQSYMPVHYTASKDFSDLALTLKPTFTKLDKDIYLGTNLCYRGLGARGKSGWSELTDKTELTPFDQVRVTILLNPEHEVIQGMINSKDMPINLLPIQVSPVRLDGWNMEGPPTKSYIKKLTKEDLTSQDLDLLKKHNLDIDQAYGATIIPFYMLGTNQIFGAKPMSGGFGSWLNTDGDEIEGLWNWDKTWEMDYGFEVVVANQADTKAWVNFADGQDEFTLTLNGQRVHHLTNKNGFSTKIPEKHLIDKEFLAVGKERAKHPRLFKGAKTFALMRALGVEGGGYFYPSTKWDRGIKLKQDKHGFPIKDVAELNTFNWSRPAEIAVLVVCDKIEKENYEKRHYDWKSVPASIQVHKAVAPLNWIDGPTYDTSLKYIGKIEESDNDVKLVWSDEHDKLPFRLQRIQKLLTRDPKNTNNDKQSLRRLKMLSGLDADDNEFENLIESWLPPSPKYVYAATVKLDYQTATGFMHEGVKPFSVITNPSPQAKARGWNLALKITTKGDSGFSNSDVDGQFNLPYPAGFEKPDAHWYIPRGKASEFKVQTKNADRLLAINKTVSKNNEAFSDTEFYDPLEPISPLVPWRVMDESDTSFWTDKRKSFVESWLQDNENRFLPMAETAVLASRDELVEESN